MNRLPAILLAAAFMNTPACAQALLRVACVGDSITYGDQIVDRGRDSYPAVLQRLSNGRYLTGNFGVNGATALKTPSAPGPAPAPSAMPSRSPPMPWSSCSASTTSAYPELHDRYPADLGEIVTRFQALPSKPRLFLCTLTPIAPPEHQVQVNQLIRDTLNPAIRAVAARTGAQIIDISAAYPNRLELLPDGLHPNPEGAELIARTVLAALDAAYATAAAPVHHPRPRPRRISPSATKSSPPASAPSSGWPHNPRRPPSPIRATPGPAATCTPPPMSPTSCPCWRVICHRNSPIRISNSPPRPCPRPHRPRNRLPRRRPPVAWREALLRQLVRLQRIDAAGGGYWEGPGTEAHPPPPPPPSRPSPPPSASSPALFCWFPRAPWAQ
jgi:hypothetical protein